MFVLYINKMPSNKRLGSGVDSERTDNRNREMDVVLAEHNPGRRSVPSLVLSLIHCQITDEKREGDKKVKKKNQSDTHTSGQVRCLNLTGGIEEDTKKGETTIDKCGNALETFFFSAS